MYAQLSLAVSLDRSLFITDRSLLVRSGVRHHVFRWNVDGYRNRLFDTTPSNKKIQIRGLRGATRLPEKSKADDIENTPCRLSIFSPAFFSQKPTIFGWGFHVGIAATGLTRHQDIQDMFSRPDRAAFRTLSLF